MFTKRVKSFFRRTFYVQLIAVMVVIIGIIISYTTSNWFWLARCGSLLVIIAVLFAATDVSTIARLVSKQSIEALGKEFADNVIKPQVLRNERKYNITGKESDEEIDKIVHEVIRDRRKQEQPKMENHLRQQMLKTELSIAALGTFLWGFADLLNCFYPGSSC